jgi:hypothetical protein
MENVFNTDLKSFAVEVFLPDLPPLSQTQWARSYIGIHTEHPSWWNVETNTSSWAPKHLTHTHTFSVLFLALPGKALMWPSWICSVLPPHFLYFTSKLTGMMEWNHFPG